MGQIIRIIKKKFWRKKETTRNSGPDNGGFFHKEPVKRALRTFGQAVAGYVIVNVTMLDFDAKNAVKGFIIAAIAAGIAAVMNMNTNDTGGEEI